MTQNNSNFNSSINRFNFLAPTNQTSLAQATESVFSIASETTSNILSSNSSIGNYSILDAFRQKESNSDLKLGLKKKLSELDELNKNLKERLEKKTIKPSMHN
jgi:hypothetical protein